MGVGLSIFFGFFLLSMIGLVGGLMILSMIAEKHTRLNNEIIEYCNSFKREFKIEERDLLEKNIKRKFPQVEFSDFEYTIHEKTKIKKEKEEKEKYIDVKVTGRPQSRIFVGMNEMKIKFELKTK